MDLFDETIDTSWLDEAVEDAKDREQTKAETNEN